MNNTEEFMRTDIRIVNADSSDFEQCLKIRRVIFIEGQNVSQELEYDGLDVESTHYLMSVNNIPIGTARSRYLGLKVKIERVAILVEYQGHRFGQQLMQFIIDDIRKVKIAEIVVLSSQVHAIPFYKKLGFSICSDVYMDAGIPHNDMKMLISNL